jgi:preprotein translocase subunit Sss1
MLKKRKNEGKNNYRQKWKKTTGNIKLSEVKHLIKQAKKQTWEEFGHKMKENRNDTAHR